MDEEWTGLPFRAFWMKGASMKGLVLACLTLLTIMFLAFYKFAYLNAFSDTLAPDTGIEASHQGNRQATPELKKWQESSVLFF